MPSIAVSAPGTTPPAPSTTQHIIDLYGDQAGARAAQAAAIGGETPVDAWHQAVDAAAASMQANCPDLATRITDAVTLVLTNQVELGLNGHANVGFFAPRLRKVYSKSCVRQAP